MTVLGSVGRIYDPFWLDMSDLCLVWLGLVSFMTKSGDQGRFYGRFYCFDQVQRGLQGHYRVLHGYYGGFLCFSGLIWVVVARVLVYIEAYSTGVKR